MTTKIKASVVMALVQNNDVNASAGAVPKDGTTQVITMTPTDNCTQFLTKMPAVVTVSVSLHESLTLFFKALGGHEYVMV